MGPPPSRTGGPRKTPLPPLSQAQAFAVILWPVSICHRTLGNSEKKCFQSCSLAHLYQGEIPSGHLAPYEAIFYVDRPLVQEEIFSKCLSVLADSLRRVEAGGTGTLAHSSPRLLWSLSCHYADLTPGPNPQLPSVYLPSGPYPNSPSPSSFPKDLRGFLPSKCLYRTQSLRVPLAKEGW